MDHYQSDLKCPISLDWLEDPVSLPCCGRAFSRSSILEWLNIQSTCPLCKKDITSYDINALPKNINVANLVETFRHKESLNSSVAPSSSSSAPSWKAQLTRISRDGHTVIGKVDITSDQPESKYKTLVIPVVDESGSMAGNPTQQVRYSIKRIIELTHAHSHIITHVVCYSDSAVSFEVLKSQALQLNMAKAQQIGRGGGTSFATAFKEIINVCNHHKSNPNVTNIVIIFLTDGEDSSVGASQRHKLVTSLKNDLRLDLPFVVHSVGFAREHDFSFLDSLRKIGSTEGAYRYADPAEDTDSLAKKMNGLFDVIVQTNSTPIEILHVPRPILHRDHTTLWLDLSNTVYTQPFEISISIAESSNLLLTTEFSEEHDSKDVWDQWYSILVDQIAGELLILNDTMDPIQKKLHSELLIRRTNAILIHLTDDHPARPRLLEIASNIKSISAGDKADLRKLSDMKYEGKFGKGGNVSIANSSAASSPAPIKSILPAPLPQKATSWITVEVPYIKRCSGKAKENVLFHALGNKKDVAVLELINSSTDMTSLIDSVRNTVLIAASAIGRIGVVRVLIDKFSEPSYLARRNMFGFTAADMACIFGYWKTLQILLQHGAPFSCDPLPLLRTCLSKGFYSTAALLLESSLVQVNNEMVSEAPSTEIAKWIFQRCSSDVTWNTAIMQGMTEVVAKKIAKCEAAPGLSWSHFYGIMRDPTHDHIKVFDLLVKAQLLDIQEKFEIDGSIVDSTGTSDDPQSNCREFTWPLFVACESGVFNFFKFVMKHLMETKSAAELKAYLREQNTKGTACLWIASCNKHSDIVAELLSKGADPNQGNHKGDSPLIPACQKGSTSICELLLDHGANLDSYNKNRDNPVLICCRAGQAKVLQLLLRTMEKEAKVAILTASAQIDGHDPLHAAAELDKAECIKVCLDHGADIESTTGDDNGILPGGTALHLTCHYGRLNSCVALIQSGANPLAKTRVGGYTPLHIAIKSGHAAIVQHLLSIPAVKASINSCYDDEGNLPAYYAQTESNAVLYDEFFRNHLASTLRTVLYRGSPELDQHCFRILSSYSQSFGVYSFRDLLADIQDTSEPFLSLCLQYGSQQITRALLTFGADVNQEDLYGITPEFWSNFMGVRSPQLSPAVQLQLDRVEKCSSISAQSKLLLRAPTSEKLESLSSVESSGVAVKGFTISDKMATGINAKIPNAVLKYLKQIAADDNSEYSLIGFVDQMKTSPKQFNNDSNQMDQLLRNARLQMIKLVASGETLLQPAHMLAIYLYSSNWHIFEQVNMSLSKWEIKKVGKRNQLWETFVCSLFQGVHILPHFQGEVYRAIVSSFNEDTFAVGKTFVWYTFGVATRDWKNVSFLTVESTKNMQVPQYGIIFIIESKYGRRIDRYSSSPVESEVVFLPGSKFQVTALYVASTIALGQANIRDSTYPAKSQHIAKAAEGKGSIIVNLVEITESGQDDMQSIEL